MKRFIEWLSGFVSGDVKRLALHFVVLAEQVLPGSTGAEKRAFVVRKINEAVQVPFYAQFLVKLAVDVICEKLNALTNRHIENAALSHIQAGVVLNTPIAEIKKTAGVGVNERLEGLYKQYGIAAEATPKVTPKNNLSPHFKRAEFACRCGCGLANPKPELIDTLEEIRTNTGPITITSGCRCDKHNTKVNGAAESGHMTGEAADFVIKGMGADKIEALVRKLHGEGKLPNLRYFYRINGTAVHVGVDNKPRKSVWG